MRRLWLIFSQTATIALALYCVVLTFEPQWFTRQAEKKTQALTLKEAPIQSQAPSGLSSFREASKKALPSVVHIFTSQKAANVQHPLFNDPLFRHFFGDESENNREQRQSSGLGSGVIVSKEGYILTNYHVVEDADQIEVALEDGRTQSARVVGSDPETDLAVLQLTHTSESLPTITLGQMENVSVGDIVLAIGNPFGVGQTVTMGIVSALGRSHLGINTFENFIQTDAAINPGNSGGALIDTEGNLIGINTAIYSRSGGSLGIGFAIPVSTVRSVMEQIIQNGMVTRGWIGIEAQEITPELAESFMLEEKHGALIAGIQRASPAENGGIKPGDILLSVNGFAIKNPQEMLDQIASQKPGEDIKFKLRRKKELIELFIHIGKRPPMRHSQN